MSLVRTFVAGVIFGAACVAADTATLALFLESTQTLHPETQQSLQAEVDRIAEGAGYRIEWRTVQDRRPEESFDKLMVLRFSGACDVATAGGRTASLASLAETPVSDGRILPFTRVHCDRVAAMLAGTAQRWTEGARRTLFGRALGRVAAHELYHFLAQTSVHAAGGVSKSCFTFHDLVSGDFRFDRLSLAQMRPESPADSEPAEEASGR